ncbi:50S ribosomal protein L11 methyltransferase [Anaerospora sp.]|jgi:ribosomal protein L11 methyltransferase|uniref:50S ribosomal protein L11 methyltransferase n=1 Tax=Anaerospora sp. TaxID=1960278 RepID=UPI00289F4261|nr:50S ribosomal protein L11 methyltransferase [Anaerospora sp.]MDF2927925.1 prmA [Anaerospora sp.]
MKWAEISIQTTHEATEAVANIFHDLGASGVIIEDPVLINAYRSSGTWDYCDLPEPADIEVVTVKAYLPVDDQLDDKLGLFEQKVNDLEQHNLNKGCGLINWVEVQDEDWASAWKEYFHPVKVSEHIVIKPSWEDYFPAVDDIVIELDPGMAFGTGTHHTTVLCIRLLDELVKTGDTVFDVGTGSGILAVAAAKLGAASVHAIDLDPVAVRVAQENVSMNHVQHTVVTAQGDLLTGVSGQADIIVANIIADIIIQILNDLPARLKDDGAFIASGIIIERLSDVTAAMLDHKFIIEKVVEEGGWAAIVARKGEL